MRKVRRFILIGTILVGLFFLFGPEDLPGNDQFQEILNSASDNDIIIIFNSGGWGNTPLEKAGDFAPVIEGIQKTLNDLGYNSIVIPYNRTKDTFLGKIVGVKDFLNSFNFSSEILAKDLEFLAEKLPNKKIIIAGLSAGGAFANETIKKISNDVQGSVYAIAAGTPFWIETPKSENILQLDNNGKDSLVKGDSKPLLSALFKVPFKWIFSKINNRNLTFFQAFHSPGHDYFWSSPEVSSQIVNFLENKLH